MKQYKRFSTPVLKTGDTAIVEVGDPVSLVLRDQSVTVVYVAEVLNGGKRIAWDLTGTPVLPVITSSQNATAAASDDTTGDALANALKTSYNAAQVDIAAIFAGLAALGSPTSSQNATTAATNDATRLALANALKVSINAAQVDVAEIFTANPPLGAPTSAQVATADGTDDATTQTLLNDLKTAYNALQVDIAEAFTVLDNGYYQPRSEDVIAVDGNHQSACEGEPNIHDGPEDDGEGGPVQQ